MTTLVFGRTGQVATELQRLADVVALGRDEADLTDPAACAAAIHAHRPRAVINAAAYTAVDRAEQDEALATIINCYAPVAMAEACAALDVPFVHISTDYVFAGDGVQTRKPEDCCAPRNAYGRSKRMGEEGVCAVSRRFVILRTSWVFSAHGANFVKTMLKLSRSQEALSVVADQIGGPTPARAIAEACLTIADQLVEHRAKSGIYHFSGEPDVSWCEFATEIVAQAGRATMVTPIRTADYSSLAVRPLNSRLDCSSTRQVFNIPRPEWRRALGDVMLELDCRK